MTNSNPQQRFKPAFKVCLICLAVLLIGGGIWDWYYITKDSIPKRFGVVEKGQLYRSGLISSTLLKKVLTKYKIKVVIDLAADSSNNPDRNAEEQAVSKLGIERLTFRLKGNGTGDVNDYAEAVATIARAKKEYKPVLVHCNAGLQRTGGVIAVYQLLVERKSPFLVYCGYVRYDWDPWNDTTLFNYVNTHMRELAVLLKKMGVINEVPDPLPVLGF
jgi:protein tyrosine phosphatase (PTP) superfamily phosphohydrolase (DUF442 family)